MKPRLRLFVTFGMPLLLALALLWCGSAKAAPEAAGSYTLAVVPQFEQRQLFATWRPIVAELERRTGMEIRLVATLTVQDFERQLAEGRFDFVYANPYHILREAPRQAYIPLVRDATPLRGILVVRKDSPYNTPEQLAGRTLAIPSYNALGASLLLRADLKQTFGIEMELINAKTHSSSYLHVVNKLSEAGGGVEKTLQEQPAAVQESLRVLYTTRDMPSHPIAAHPRVPAAARENLRKALLEIAADPKGKLLLEEIPMREMVRTSISDYETMARWGLERFWVK